MDGNIVSPKRGSGQQSLNETRGITAKSAAWLRISATAVLLWFAQPPLGWWPLAFIAVVPWLYQITLDSSDGSRAGSRRQYGVVWIVATLYWLVTLQGLRFAHPAMFLCWIALSGYLAIYPVCFFVATKAWLRRGVPLIIAAPALWVGIECIRNYMLTGISAAMLGHTLADVPMLVQIADLGGTYAVSLLVIVINVAIADWVRVWQAKMDGKENPSGSHLPSVIREVAPGRSDPLVNASITRQSVVVSSLVAVSLLAATAWYGNMRLSEPVAAGTTRFLVVGRDESVEYDQDSERAEEIFTAYVRETLSAAKRGQSVDVVVWPESMFTGGVPWYIAEPDAVLPEFMNIDEYQSYFEQRTMGLGQAVADAVPQDHIPHLIVGCGVVRFTEVPLVYSAIVHVDSSGSVKDWYGKNHLVMFGEYIPLVKWIPGLRSLVPPGLGVQPGSGPTVFELERSRVAGNICIETAVERVAVDHCSQLRTSGGLPDAIVTVTNDGWFDHSSVVEHHLRCAQLVAIGCRRPILSSANGGPTVWIDSCGRVVEKLAYDQSGAILATPGVDSRESVYVRIRDWPSRLAGLAAFVTLIFVAIQSRRQRLIAATAISRD